MRSEKEMYNLILSIAENDERIRAVYLNGSRTNPNIPKDIFQDYDVVYVVNETKTFIDDKDWIKLFGEAKVYKAIDGLEAIIQHNISDLSTWIPKEYELNKVYADDKVDFSEYMKALREEIRKDTLEKIGE